MMFIPLSDVVDLWLKERYVIEMTNEPMDKYGTVFTSIKVYEDRLKEEYSEYKYSNETGSFYHIDATSEDIYGKVDDVIKRVENGRMDWALKLYPRSGLGFKYGVKLRNTTGIIDCDYRDEIRVSLSSDERVVIPKGKAYMQGIIQPVFTLDNEIEPTEERKGGLGSTDKD